MFIPESVKQMLKLAGVPLNSPAAKTLLEKYGEEPENDFEQWEMNDERQAEINDFFRSRDEREAERESKTMPGYAEDGTPLEDDWGYEEEEHQNDMSDIPPAACGICGGWSKSGGMSQHTNSKTPVMGRTGCTCNKPENEENTFDFKAAVAEARKNLK